MYEIYINERPIFLMNSKDILGRVMDQSHLIGRYTGKVKNVMNYVDTMEKSPKFHSVTLHYHDLDQLWADFQTQFQLIEAAGGVVENPSGDVLVIFRRGSWDLPKGKIDDGETPEVAAVREINEETGLMNITLGAPITETYHTYDIKGKRILKKTYWYKMTSTDTSLTPQTEEDIEKAEWVDLKPFLQKEKNIFLNIRKVLSLY